MELTIRIVGAVLGLLGACVVALDGVRYAKAEAALRTRRAARKLTGSRSGAQMSGGTLTSPGVQTTEQRLTAAIVKMDGELAEVRRTVAELEKQQVRSDAWGILPIGLGVILGALPGEISRSPWAYVPVLTLAAAATVASVSYLWKHRRG